MNKKEAAEFLGVSVRSLERFVQQGKISVRYEKGRTRPTANFDETELEEFREQLNQPSSYKPAVKARQITTVNHSQQDTAVYQSGEIAEFGENLTVVERLSAVIEVLLARTGDNTSDRVGEKLLLTIAESQRLTGLSRQVLRDAITQGKLKAKVIGRSWRIKRSDLEEFVEHLF